MRIPQLKPQNAVSHGEVHRQARAAEHLRPTGPEELSMKISINFHRVLIGL